MRKLTMVYGLALALSLAWTVPAVAKDPPDPNQIAERCITMVTEKAARSAERMGEDAARCVETIEELLEAGRVRAAHHVARAGVRHIRKSGERTVRGIRLRCRACIRVLLRLGAPELAQQVAEARAAAVRTVRDAGEAAVQSIRDALPEPVE